MQTTASYIPISTLVLILSLISLPVSGVSRRRDRFGEEPPHREDEDGPAAKRRITHGSNGRSAPGANPPPPVFVSQTFSSVVVCFVVLSCKRHSRGQGLHGKGVRSDEVTELYISRSQPYSVVRSRAA